MVESRKPRHHARKVTLGFLLTMITLLAGCGIGSARKDPLEIKVQNIEMEKTELMRDLQQCKTENVLLTEQIKALSALGADRSLAVYKLKDIRITKYSNFYDKNDDGRREKLIVYIQPLDTAGDIVKAAGTVDVQLWNLNNLNGQALLGQWQVDPTELHKEWFNAMISSSYRLTFDTPASLDVLAEPLTVKVTFTDYLTGEIFRSQQVIDPTRSQ